MSPNPANLPLSNLDPISYEIDAGPLSLLGAIPDGLRGMLVRNGPNSVIPDPHAHWLFGDGMLMRSGFRIDRCAIAIAGCERRIGACASQCPRSVRRIAAGPSRRRALTAAMAWRTPASFSTRVVCWRSKRSICRSRLTQDARYARHGGFLQPAHGSIHRTPEDGSAAGELLFSTGRPSSAMA